MFVCYLYLYGSGNNYECKIFKNYVDVVSNYSIIDRPYYKYIIPILFNLRRQRTVVRLDKTYNARGWLA